jgi:hypothetical protein
MYSSKKSGDMIEGMVFAVGTYEMTRAEEES